MARKFYAKLRRRGNQKDVRRRRRGKRRFAEDASNSSDEDYVLDEEEEDDDDDDEGLSTEVNESDEEEEAQSTSSEDSEELSDAPKSRKPRRNHSKSDGRAQTSKEKPRNRATKRVKISSSDDEDFEPDLSSTTDDDEYDDESEEEETAVVRKSLQKRKRVTKSKRSSTRKPKKKKRRTSVSKRSVRKKKRNPALQNLASKRRKTTSTSHISIRNTDHADSVSEAYFVKPPKRPRSQRKASRNEETEWSAESVSEEHFVVPPKRARSQRKSSRNEATGWRSTRSRKSIPEPDFTCSESDADYTISEEDSEPSYRSHGCKKTTSRSMRSLSMEKQEIVSSGKDQQKKYTSLLGGKIKKEEEGWRRKGKQKVEESENAVDAESSKPVCGICLSEDGKPSRGKLDCCDHYFCFACIMEWAKVESRCPMCKQRFRTISKSSKSGKGLRGTTIKVPVRNQVYQPSEEEVMGFLDPYANIVCLDCNEAGDDDLLLLCDRCDSAYHTYCVGLGRAIPEGDWYCQGCQTSMPGQSSTHEEEVEDFVLDLDNGDEGLGIRGFVEDAPVGTVSQRLNLDLNLSPPSSSSAPLTDTRPSHVRTIRRRILRRSTPNPSPRLPDAARVSVRQTQVSGSTSQVSSVRARTLSGQRMLQEHVQALHDNWTAPERGFQQFSPGSSLDRFCVRDGADAIVQPTPNNRSLLFREPGRRSNLAPILETENAAVKSDVDQAWVMMERAKALRDDNIDLANSQTDGRRHWQGSSSGHKNNDFSELVCNARSRVGSGRILTASVRSRTSNSQDRHNPATVNYLEDPERITEEISCREIGNNILPAPSVSNGILGLRFSERSNSSHHQLNNSTSFSKKSDENRDRKVEGAKDKVISMVKSHMKHILTREHIDKDLFKEIARCCTHTILAACGIEHSRSRVQPFEVVSCSHTDQVLQYSELMPECCTDCFNSFVKELVGRIADGKVGTNS